jgi:thymidylate synthase
MMNVNDIRKHFMQELAAERFTTDKTGQQTIEIIGASFIADEPSIFGTPSEEYVAKEFQWYKSQSTNINDIYGPDRAPPAAWVYSANKHGEINSNYGKLIFADQYYNQYAQARDELIKNPDGRRATMIYNRPSIWSEYNQNGKSDFICTNAVSYYIRDSKLHAVVQMRSNDAVFGYKNDYAWQKEVMQMLCNDINDFDAVAETFGPILTIGNLHWQVQNLHVYSRHFHLLKD